MSDTWFKSSKEATCSNNTHICEDFWRPAWGAWSGGKGNGANDWAIIPKTITQTSSIWAASTTKKWDFSLKNLCVYIQNCASCVGGEHIFIKKVKKDGRKMKIGSEKSSMASLMRIKNFPRQPFSAQSAKTTIFWTAQDGNDPPKVMVLKPLWE